MTKEFELEIEKLYHTFSKYPFQSSIEGCPCCVSDADKSNLHSKELRALEDDDISHFAFKAMTTFGELDDFKHYLPRIFELCSKRQIGVDTFVVLGKITYGEWEKWDKEEQNAIYEFLAAWWKFDINNNAYFDSELFIEIQKIISDLPILLKSWSVDVRTNGFKNYVEFIEEYYYLLLKKGKLFKEFKEEEIMIFKSWIQSNSNELEKGFFEYENEDQEFAGRISNVLYMLERIE